MKMYLQSFTLRMYIFGRSNIYGLKNCTDKKQERKLNTGKTKQMNR